MLPDPENKATNIKLHPSLSTLLPSHAHPPPSRPEAKAPRHAQKRVGTDPTHPHSPASFSPSPPPPFLLIIILVLNFQKHTRRENATVLPEQLRLCFQTAYYHQSGWIFSPPPFFSFTLARVLLPPPNHHHHIFNGFQAITVSPKVEKENSRWDAAPVEKFNKMWKPSTLFQPPFRESVCDRKRAHARVQKHPRYSPQSWVKNFLFLTHMHTHTQTHQVGNWVQMGIFHNGWAQLTKWLTGWLHEAWLPVRHKLEECKESLHSPGASSLKYTHAYANLRNTNV